MTHNQDSQPPSNPPQKPEKSNQAQNLSQDISPSAAQKSGNDFNSPNTLDLDNQSTGAIIQQYLQRGMMEAREKSESLAKQVNRQAKFLKSLTVLFAFFFTYLQVRQIYVDNAGSQQASKFSSWEMVQNIQGKDVETSAGLAIALKTLIKTCEPLSGLNLSKKYLPGIQLVVSEANLATQGLTKIGEFFFFVKNPTNCHQNNNEEQNATQLDLGIDFTEATLQEATFSDTNLTGAIFQDAKLQEATFEGASSEINKLLPMKATNFQRTNLTNATLRNVDLSQATLKEAQLIGAKLNNVVLAEADLSGADLSGANLTAADLTGVNLDSANLAGTNLQEVQGLTPEGVQSALNWIEATYDEGFCQQWAEQTVQPQSCV